MDLQLGGVYINLGLIEKQDSNFVDAEKFFYKSMEHYKKANDEKGISTAYMNLGENQVEALNYSEAIPNLIKSLELAK